ncbi:hypothetical protein FRC15_001922 [Serendipita sp. 397]|nr:hypothetical protein FRC15_001922 [Serendipita sp. 397]KAG8788198.1 hypothetical protein FRC16_001442 [Serendipita sp. 398]
MRFSTFGLVIFSALGSSRALAPANVTWSNCPDTTGVECATVQVPLDWADESKGMIPIALSRVPAKTPQREGYMFFNPGGPGGSGTEFVQNLGPIIQFILGRGMEIISWDPRGIAGSGPNITLFSGEADYEAFWNPLYGKGHLGAHGNLTITSDVDFIMTQVSAFDGIAQSLNQKMIERNGDLLKYVGTCAVVRDLVYLVDSVYGQGTDVNLYGISYGTVIATYLTQMFPDRVGRVIIDGVLDPEKYGNNIPMKWAEADVYDVDFALKSWTEACAGSKKCPFSNQNDTSSTLLTKIDTILNTAIRSLCHKWTSRAVERLPQKINKPPKNVVLVLGNMGDPITPYYSARRLASSDQLGTKARLVLLKSIGHSTLSNNSTCITDVVKKFIAGTPPDDAGNDDADVTCDIEQTIFGPVPSAWQQFQFNQTHDEPTTSSNSPSGATRFGASYSLFFLFASAALLMLR